MPSADDTRGPIGDLVANHLGRIEDAMLSRVLTTTLAEVLPPAMVRVERRRSIVDRLPGRLGELLDEVAARDERTRAGLRRALLD